MTNSIAIRKVVIFTLIAALLTWTGAAYVASIAQPARAASAGDLIKMDGNPAVYYLGSDLKRYVFPNQNTYNTWYADFSGVVTVAQSELESYAIGGNVTYRAGTRLGKITTDPKVYAVEPGGVLRWITSESVASDLYGSNWNTKIDDIPDPFFVNYSVGSDVTTSSYPAGALVKATGSSDIYYIDGANSKRMVQDTNAFNANRFRDEFVQETSQDLNAYSPGSPITGAETDLVTVAGPEVGSPSTSSTGTLSVSLAADTPAAATAVENAARVGFTKVNLTASGGDVTIDSLRVERQGVSSNSAFADVILLDVSNNTPVALAEQIGNEKNLSSDDDATFNEDILIPNGTTKSLMIAGNMAATLSAGEVAQLALMELNLVGSATVSGSLPVVGNGMTMNGSVAIATVDVTTGGQDPSASTQNVGETDYVFTSLKITAGGQEDVEISRILFTQNGTAADDDVGNLELVVDGAVVGTVANPVNDLVDFRFDNPILISEGNNKEFVLRGDILDGSSRTISLDIEDKIDIVAQGKTFGFFRLPSFSGSNAGTVSPFFNADDTTIDTGSISFSKGVVSSLNAAEGADDQILGAFRVTVQGEPVEVTQFVLGVSVTGTGNAQDVSNLTIKDPSGKVVAGPVDPDTGVTARDTATTTDTIIFPVGTNTYTVEGDLTSDFASNDTIQLDLAAPNNLVDAEGSVTSDTITAVPTSDLSLDTITVKIGSLNVSTASQPAAQSVIVGQTGFTFANYILDASASGEDVRVTQLALVHKTSGGREDHIANLQLFDGATPLFPIEQPSNVSGSTATTTFSLTSPILVNKGTIKTITLKGDIVGGATGDTHSFGCNGGGCMSGTGVETSNTITPNTTNSDGQTMTIVASGTLTVAEDASSPQADGLLVAGSSDVTVGEVLLSAFNEDIDLTDLHFVINSVNGGALNDEISLFKLFDGSTQIASVVPTTTAAATFENLDGKFVIAKGSSGRRLTVKVDTAAVTNNQGDGNTADSGDGISVDIQQDAYSAKGVSSGTDLAAASKSGTFTGKQFTVHKSVPTFTKLALASNTLVNSSGVALYKFRVAADPKGDIGFYKASFTISTSTATVTSFELFESPGTANEVNLTNNGVRSVDEILTASSGGTGGEYGISVLFDTGTDGVGSGGEFRFISAGQSKDFELQGTVANSVSGSTVSTALRGDDARNTTAYPDKASGVDADEDNDFIWSDLHYGNSSTTATQTLEWFNSYKVPGLNSTSTAENLSR